MITTLDECIEYAIKGKNLGENDCKIELELDGEKIQAYTVSIAYRELIFYCDGLTVSFDVNTIGGRHSILLFEINRD
jgi:hypothetical protein